VKRVGRGGCFGELEVPDDFDATRSLMANSVRDTSLLIVNSVYYKHLCSICLFRF